MISEMQKYCNLSQNSFYDPISLFSIEIRLGALLTKKFHMNFIVFMLQLAIWLLRRNHLFYHIQIDHWNIWIKRVFKLNDYSFYHINFNNHLFISHSFQTHIINAIYYQDKQKHQLAQYDYCPTIKCFKNLHLPHYP